jgi:hypothetical protein
MQCFISTCELEGAQATAIIKRLMAESWEVDHFPRGPTSDPRWPDWYERGCAAAISRADAVVAVVTSGWNASCWMAHEAWTAFDLARPLFLWNPAGTRIPVGMRPYAEHTLPADLEAAVATVRALVRAI